jgi:iron complex transport system ATP-binding protein
MESFFNINNLTSGYGTDFHIKNINLQIPKGSYTGIIGPNGSGKSTLFRTITCELACKHGSISINGQDIHKMSVKQKAQNIAIVSQNIESAYIPVDEYVLMGRYPYHNRFQFFETQNDRAIANKFMELTGIGHLKDKYLNQLSGGEQQLAGIAKALTQEPEILLLDEPTSHLDITHQVQILNLLQRLNEQLGLTVLMVIHDLNLGGEYCNQLIMMNKGQIHVQGTPEEVLVYSNIEQVYETIVVTKTNPVSGKPVIFLVSEKVLKNMKKD